jgi:hypothetical protein
MINIINAFHASTYLDTNPSNRKTPETRSQAHNVAISPPHIRDKHICSKDFRALKTPSTTQQTSRKQFFGFQLPTTTKPAH